jgi:hypothetical protein
MGRLPLRRAKTLLADMRRFGSAEMSDGRMRPSKRIVAPQ